MTPDPSPLVYVCTLGQRPEAITVALDILCKTYLYEQVVVLHTEPHFSDIAGAFKNVMKILREDYVGFDVGSYQLCYENGAPIIDIQDPHSASAYHLSLLHALIDYKTKGYTVHLMVAGGRKAMSIYAALAATLVLRPPDRLLTVVSPSTILKPGLFHISSEWQSHVHIVDLPFTASRLLPGYIQDLLAEGIGKSTRQRLWEHLTPQERALLVVLENNPHVSNEKLASMQHKKLSTVENQLRSIYKKLSQYYDLSNPTQKRQMLVDVLTGRL